MISKQSNRIFRDKNDVQGQILLNRLLESDISAGDYRETMFKIGCHLGQSLSQLVERDKKYCVVSTVEDADYLAKGIIDVLRKKASTIFLVCLWNQRSTVEETNTSIAPIYNRFYQAGYEQADDFIVVKSIISGSCVVKTNITEIFQRVQPKAIHVVAPVMHIESEFKLRSEFPERISSRFDFTYIAQDSIRDEASGEVSPGLGGNVYEKLGFIDQSDKNSYFPEIVKERLSA
ncbi:MAG: hypothetical protein P8Y45_00860 [Exilibacterium sp.]